jgi:hypothetical protein
MAGRRWGPNQMREAGFRYGAVLIVTLTVLLFSIVAPASDLSRAVGVALVGAMLLIVAVTSGAPKHTRRVSIFLAVFTLGVSTGLVGSGALTKGAAFTLTGVMTLLALLALIAGVFRLMRTRGVTIQAVIGALSLYLLLALLFAYAIGAVAEISNEPYFAQSNTDTQSQRTYFSVTTVTTTGFGDLTPATKAGRALTVVEELFGQLYLVTVVSLLIANVGRGPREGGGPGRGRLVDS